MNCTNFKHYLYKTKVRELLIIAMLLVMMQLAGCNNNLSNIDVIVSPAASSQNDIQSTPIVVEESIDSSGFINSSLQDGFCVKADDILITKIQGGQIFDEVPHDGKYSSDEVTIEKYFGLDEVFYAYTIFPYKGKIVYAGTAEETGVIYIQDSSTKNIQTINHPLCRSVSYYILGNRLYFDEYKTIDYGDKYGYTIKYLNLDTLAETTVYTYENNFENASFVLKKDGGVAFSISDSEGMTQIFTCNKGEIREIIKKRWCNIVEYNERGIFYSVPAKTDEELSQLFDSVLARETELILETETGEAKVLLEYDCIYGPGFKILDDYFIHLKFIEQGEMAERFICKYDYDGVLQGKVKFKESEDYSSKRKCADLVYYEGEIKNICYNGSTREMEIIPVVFE